MGSIEPLSVIINRLVNGDIRPYPCPAHFSLLGTTFIPYTLHRPWAISRSLPQNFQRSTKNNAYVTWRTLRSRDAHAQHVILIVAYQNFYRCCTSGYLSNSWASCFRKWQWL